tara:strand:+ start:293 stop:772 length:480 start_codon:yes stop_codon:yes gene_type:complete
MSYDLLIIPNSDDLSIESVSKGLDQIEHGESYPFGEPTKELEACAREIWEHYPPLSELADDEMDKAIWSCDHDTVDGYMYMTMFLSIETSTLNTIVEIARKHGLVVFDPQLSTFPDTYTEDTMSVKDTESVKQQIEEQLCGFLNDFIKDFKNNGNTPSE